MRMRRALALLSLVSLCSAQKWRSQETWEHRGTTYTKSCSNLTQVLDNWKYAIMTQVKDLLVNDHASVLPEYVRIQPLSEALGELYKQFNTLKENLVKLTTEFDKVEAFVDDLQAGKLPKPPLWIPPRRPIRRVPPHVQLRAPVRASGPGPLSQKTRGQRVPRL